MQEYKTVGTIKYPQNLDSEKQALIDMLAKNYAEELRGIENEKKANNARIRLGSAISGASFHPILNVPYVGTGIGGAMYDLGQGIVEGDEAKDLAKRAARGFAIGETVGAIPYAGKLASKTKVGQAAGKALDEAAEKFAQTKAYDVLMSEFAPVEEIYKKAILEPQRKMRIQKSVGEKVNPFAKAYNDVLYDSANPRHRLQAELINKHNPAPDSYHTWVRNADDIYNFEDTLKPPQFDPDFIGNDFDPSYTWDMAQNAIKNGEMEVYSSYPIKKGVFVTPSSMEAQAYAGNGKIYSKKVPLDDVAWIDERQGQYAPIDKEYMESVFNDSKKGIKRLSKQDYRRLGKQYYSNEFMPKGIKKENYGQIDYINHNRGKDEIEALKHYPKMNENIQNAEYGFTSNHNNEADREYDHLINSIDKEVLDIIIEKLNNGKNIYKMTKVFKK